MAYIKHIIPFLFFCSCIVSQGYAQWHPFTPYDSPQALKALSSQSITAMLQDERGFIWFGTKVGLNRFDGRHVKQYFFNPSDPHSISDNQIEYDALYEHNGLIWIGTLNGLNKYDPNQDQFHHIIPKDSTTASHCTNSVSSIIASNDSTLWIGTIKGLCRLNLSSNSFDYFINDPSDSNSLSDNRVMSFAIDKYKQLWIATRNGVNLFDKKDRTFTRYLTGTNTGDFTHEGFPTAFHSVIAQDDNLWLGSANGGLIRRNITSGAITHFKHIPSRSSSIGGNFIPDILVDHDNTLWVATFGGGLCRLNTPHGSFSCDKPDDSDPASIVNDQVTVLLQDYEGHIWSGTWNGVSRRNKNAGFDRLSYNPSNDKTSISANQIKAIYEDKDGIVWIGGIGGGLDAFDPATGEIKNIRSSPNGLNSNKIWSITGTERTLWIGSENGLNKYNTATRLFTSFVNDQDNSQSLSNNLVYTALVDNQERVWASTVAGGINMLQNAEYTDFFHFKAGNHPDSLLSNDIWPIYQDDDGVLWFGSFQTGLYRYDESRNAFINYAFSDDLFSLSANSVMHINGDERGNIWIGTAQGLNRFEKSSGKFNSYSKDDGLPHNYVSCILSDDNNDLWIGTSSGLSYYNAKENAFSNFYEKDGLANVSFESNACHKGHSGRFYFGTASGLVSFFPEEVKVEVVRPKLAVTELQVNNTPVSLNPTEASRKFTFRENTMQFRVAALAMGDPEQNRLQYRLLGQDTTWIDNGTSDNFVFNYLDPNEYVLEVKAQNSFGLESLEPARLAFTITPPYWQTWWFRILAGLLIIGIGIAIYRTRVNYLLDIEKTKLEEKIKFDRLRERIAADFHDGLGSSIASLMLQMDLAADAEDTPDQTKDQLNLYRHLLSDISQFRRDMTWVVDSGHDSLAHLLDRITATAIKMIPDSRLAIELPNEIPEQSLSMQTRQHLLFFTQEALHNAAKHAQATNILLHISRDENEYTFIIKDDGIGFDPKTIKQGGGMKYMPFRAEALGATFSIQQPPEGGTTINLVLKMDD